MVSTKTTATTIRIPNETLAVLRRLSAESGKSQSQLVTEALAAWLKRGDITKQEDKT